VIDNTCPSSQALCYHHAIARYKGTLWCAGDEEKTTFCQRKVFRRGKVEIWGEGLGLPLYSGTTIDFHMSGKKGFAFTCRRGTVTVVFYTLNFLWGRYILSIQILLVDFIFLAGFIFVLLKSQDTYLYIYSCNIQKWGKWDDGHISNSMLMMMTTLSLSLSLSL
jgi:hypothetical protein